MKTAIYSRKSRFTGKGDSIANQIELCRQYIQSHDSNVKSEDILVYEDEGFSGGNTNRPEFRRMLEDARSGRFSALVCYRLDRISRNIGDFARLIEELNTLHVAFVSIREQFDTDSPIGRAMMYIASVFSQLERETTAERIRDNMRELARTGRWLGGMTPTGYRSVPAEKISADGKTRRVYQLAFQPAEIETVRLIFRSFLEKKSLTQVETFLLQREVRSRKGKRYTRFAIKNILENPVYMTADRDAFRYLSDCGVELCAEEKEFDGKHGIMAYNKTLQRPGKANRIREKENWIVAVGKHQGILSGRDWVRAQTILSRNSSRAYRSTGNTPALLSGLLRCGCCASYMRPKLAKRTDPPGDRTYGYLCELKEKSHGKLCSVCSPRGNELDRAVCTEVERLSEDAPVFCRELSARLREFGAKNEGYLPEISRLERSVKSREQKISNLLEALSQACGEPARDDIAARIARLHEENRAASAKLTELNRCVGAVLPPKREEEIVRQAPLSFPDAFAALSAEEKRAALRLLIRTVRWDGENAEIDFAGSGGSAPKTSAPQRENSK